MANDLTGNPLRVDTAATAIASFQTGGVDQYSYIQAIQWVNDAGAAGGAIANADDLIMHVNGVLVQLLAAATAANMTVATVWEVTFPTPIRVKSFVVDTIDGGTVFIWKA